METSEAASSIAWIPLLPLLAAAVSGVWLLLLRRSWPSTLVWLVHCSAPALAFGLAVHATWTLATSLEPGDRVLVANLYTWISAGDFHAELAFLLDPLSAVVTLLVTGVGALVHVYAAGRMRLDARPDGGYQRFLLYLNLLVGSTLVLVLADNLVLLFLGWQVVGLATYLLVGFWYLDADATGAARSSVLAGRIGDLGVLMALCLLFWAFSRAGHPTLGLRAMAEQAPLLAAARVDVPWWLGLLRLDVPTWGLTGAAGALLLLGACARAAQLPFQGWLSRSAIAPAPASALVQSATTAVAGIYLLARFWFVFERAPGALTAMAWLGGATALVGALVALAQRDITRVLSWSTISQLGFALIALGVGAYSAAVFWVLVHAFAKSLLLLAAGSVIVALRHERRLERMGGLRRPLPWTHAAFLAGALALAGLPPTAGSGILAGVARASVAGAEWLFALSAIAAALTAFYIARLYLLVFDGRSRASYSAVRTMREHDASMVFPLVVLAVLALFATVFAVPDSWGAHWDVERSNSLHHFLVPAGEAAPSSALALAASLVTALGGVALATSVYRRDRRGSPRWLSSLAPVQRVLVAELGIDRVQRAVVVRPLRGLARWVGATLDARWIDAGVVDGAARGVALQGRILRRAQSGLVQSYLFAAILGALAIAGWLLGGAR